MHFLLPRGVTANQLQISSMDMFRLCCSRSAVGSIQSADLARPYLHRFARRGPDLSSSDLAETMYDEIGQNLAVG